MAQTQLAFKSTQTDFNTSLTTSLKNRTYTSIADYLGENEFTVSSAIPCLLPAICSFLDSNEPQSRDLGKISALITNYRESLGNFNLNKIETTNYATLTDIGTNDLTELFGSKLSALLNNISLVTGLKEESVFTLLALMTPYLLKQVGMKLPKGTAFVPALLELIDENKESFQDLIRNAKPRLVANEKQKVQETGLLPYFIILSLAAFFIFSGLSYLAKRPEKYLSLQKTIVSNIEVLEKKVWSLLNLNRVVTVSGEVDSEGVISPEIEEAGSDDAATVSTGQIKSIPEEEPPTSLSNEESTKADKIEIVFDPKKQALVNENKLEPLRVSTNSLSKDIEIFLNNDAGIMLRTFKLDKVKFPFGKSILDNNAVEQLLQVVPLLKDRNDLHIEIAGHTDSSGPDYANMTISKERANAVANILAKNGLVASTINIVGYGSSRPIASNLTAEGRNSNRRIELLLVKKN